MYARENKHHGQNTLTKTEALQLAAELRDLSRSGLMKMYDQQRKLFCYRVIKNRNDLYYDGHSVRYSIISLLGLYRAQASGNTVSFNMEEPLQSLEDNVHSFNNIGDIGLLIWLCALFRPDHLSRLLADLDLRMLLGSFVDACQARTTELSWFLTGLSYLALAPVPKPCNLSEISRNIYELIKKNYGSHGIFGHQSKNTLVGKLRGGIGSFADQVYPIYAFSRYAQAYDNKEALQIALECGKTICRLQGPLGQWWWHYDAHTGNVIGRYPVYSVHQHSMAPMALFALSDVSRIDFTYAVNRGLAWIIGNNELGANLIDYKRKVIWRNLYLNKYKMRCEELRSVLSGSTSKEEPNEIKILYESRPYCLGWLLYAFAGKIK